MKSNKIKAFNAFKKSKDASVLKNLKEHILSLLKASTAYGIPNLVNSENLFSKIFWIFYLCVSAVLSIWFVNGTVNDYFNYDVVTKIEKIYEQPSKFPTVSFCSYDENEFKNKNLKQIIKGCWFATDTNCRDKKENHFESFFNQQGKQCYRINSGKNLTDHSIPVYNSTVGGRDDSIKLDLNDSKGIIVWIHDSLSPPGTQYLNNEYGNGILVSPNAETQFVIHKVVEKKLEKPYNQCYRNVSDFELDKTIIDYIQMKNETYKQSNCFELCFELDYIQNDPCNCSNVTLDNLWSECFTKYLEKNDTGSNIVNCTMDYKESFYENSLIEKCSRYCPLECDSLSYSVSVYSFTNDERKAIKQLSLYVYYRDLKYTSITQQPKMLEFDLISNIGGTLGLFIGLSFVTLFEIGEILLQISFTLLNFNVINRE